jgi:AcrR family transcriptional regulator
MTDQLPPGLELLWGIRDRPRRERKRGLSLDRIVGAAVELADADGLDAVSMSRVAERLGFTTMSLYRHVESKDDLLALMLDAASEPPVTLDAPFAGWRDGLERWCRELLVALEHHPWVLHLPIGGPAMTPSQFAWLDRGLQVLADTNLTEPEKAASVLLLNGAVMWQARLSGELGPETAQAAMLITPLVDAERFPALRRALDAGIFEDESIESDLAFGLERVLDGIGSLVASRAA